MNDAARDRLREEMRRSLAPLQAAVDADAQLIARKRSIEDRLARFYDARRATSSEVNPMIGGTHGMLMGRQLALSPFTDAAHYELAEIHAELERRRESRRRAA